MKIFAHTHQRGQQRAGRTAVFYVFPAACLLAILTITTTAQDEVVDHIEAGLVTFDDSSEQTIAAGVLVATGSNHLVDTESDAASDDLDTITPAAAGRPQPIWIRPAHDDRTIVLKDGTGNIECLSGSDLTLDDETDLACGWYDPTLAKWLFSLADGSGGGGGAPTDATYLTTSANGTLSAEVVITDSASFAAVLSDETGTGAFVLANSPTLVTPALGTPSALTLTNATGLPISTGLAASTSADLRGVLSDETGTGSAVFATSPTLVTPALGTPSALTLTNATGLPIATGLAASTSADLLGVLSDETGTGSAVFGTSPTIATPTIAGAVTWPDDVRQTFNPGTTNAGLNVGALAGDPSTPSNGDVWYDSTAEELTARINGANVALSSGGGGSEWTDGGTYLSPNETGDDLILGDGVSGVTGKVEIGGDADQPQFVVEGHSAQNSAIAAFYVPGGSANPEVEVNQNGVLKVRGGAASSGVLDLYEDEDFGGHYTRFQVPSLAASVTYTLPPDDGDAGEQLQTNGAGVLTWEAAGSGSVTLDAVGDPAGATTLESGATSETFDFTFTSAFTTGDQFQIRQITGNPTGGRLVSLEAADSDVTVLHVGDGTNGVEVSQAGALSAVGTGSIVATSGDSATSFFSSGTIENARLDNDLGDIAALTPTKGNLLVGNGTDWIALGVGTDGYLVTADSAEASGVKWSAAGAADNLGNHTMTQDLNLGGFGLDDANANEMVTFSVFASAVNNIQIANAVAASGPEIATVGGDANIALNLATKGTANINLKDSVAITGTLSVSGGLSAALDVGAYQITSSGTADIDLHSNDELFLRLGDTAGTDKVRLYDAAAVEVGSWDSDGTITAAGNAAITGTLSVTGGLAAALDVGTSQITSSGTADIDLHSNDEIFLRLGDAAASDKIRVYDSAAAEVATIDSDGGADFNSLILDTPLAAAEGGTGAATLTDGGVLLGSGTGALTAMAVLADGEMIVGDGTTDPAAESGATLRASIGSDNASNLTSGTIPAARMGADSIDAITEIAAAIKSGSDAKLVTGTAGTDGQIATWDANGDVVGEGFPDLIGVASSAETGEISVGTGKLTFRAPYAFTMTAVRASVTVAPTGSALTIDVNESGTSVLSTKLTIDATEKTSTTAASAAVISDSAIADDAELTIDFDGVGATTAGEGVKVYIYGTRTL